MFTTCVVSWCDNSPTGSGCDAGNRAHVYLARNRGRCCTSGHSFSHSELGPDNEFTYTTRLLHSNLRTDGTFMWREHLAKSSIWGCQLRIAHDDLQRLDLFQPAQFLRIPHNQLPLLRLRTQATNYIPTHLHLSNTHTYTPYAEQYCPLCLPLQTPGDETHTLLHCPHFSPLTQPAIDSLMLHPRQFNLWA